MLYRQALAHTVYYMVGRGQLDSSLKNVHAAEYGIPSTKCTCNLTATHLWMRLKLAANAPQ